MAWAAIAGILVAMFITVPGTIWLVGTDDPRPWDIWLVGFVAFATFAGALLIAAWFHPTGPTPRDGNA